ncbi:MAG: hypothetical protein CBD16_03745 [Betaproteobacteria bacterium TMED156]|nr:MAG: hypothetical protein CBD16_03745 [Betaproteobacteria bacterium TMED156]
MVASYYNLKKSEENLLTKYENIDGTPVVITKHFEENNKGELIILAHGFAGSTSFMRSIAVSLANAGHTTIRFDFLGHGKHKSPFLGNVRDPNGPSERFIKQLNLIIDTFKKKYQYSKVILIGHSMASDIIIRSANVREDIRSVIAISTYTDVKLKKTFPNLLILNGEWERKLIKKTIEIFNDDGINNVNKNVTYGSLKNGTARRMQIINDADHVGILYSTDTQIVIADWLQELEPSFEIRSSNSIGFWAASAFTSLFFIFITLIKLFPRKKSVNFEINKKRLCIVIILSSIFIPFFLQSFRVQFLNYPVHNYVINYFSLISLCIIFFTPLKFNEKWLNNFNFITFSWMIFFYIIILGGLLDSYISSYFLSVGRITVFLLLSISCIFFCIVLQMIYESGKYGWLLANFLKLNVLISLSIAIYLNFDELFLMAYLILLFILFGLIFGFLSNLLNKKQHNYLSTGTANGIVLALTYSSAVPLYYIS